MFCIDSFLLYHQLRSRNSLCIFNKKIMARTASNMVSLYTVAPNFNLLDTTSNQFKNLDELTGEKGTVIFFICNHCPYVHHVIDEVVRISNDFRVQGINFVALSSNDIIAYPEDAPELMTEFAIKHKFNFPYLYDESQKVAKQYDAACTPDFYLFNANRQLIYRGQIDDSRPQNGMVVSGADLRNAIDALLSNKKILEEQKPSIGCNIKWKLVE